MRKRTGILVLLIPLLCLLACSAQHRKLRSKSHDQILFERATTAVHQKQFSVANLTLQTLINTYPKSKYANRAKQMLQDPRIARCGEGFSSTPALCDPDIAAHRSQ